MIAAAAAACVGAVGVTLGALAPQQPGRGQMPAPPSYPSEEYLLLGNANRGAGEPMIAVDPTNPKNIIAVAMGSVQQLHGKPAKQGGTDEYHLVANSTITWLAVTNDGGIVWDVKELPILSGKMTRCPDSFADVTADGVFIAGCEPRETASDPDFWGESALMISRDKGKTWGPVVPLISDAHLDRFAPGLKPVSGGFPPKAADRVASNSPWDRPFTYIDDSTGTIYGVAKGGSAVVDVEKRQRRSQAYITASTDGGKSFGTIYSWDSPQYPQMSRGIGADAAHGVVAVTYIASSAPASENAACPCAVFGLSRDRGKTFAYHVLKNITVPAPNPAAGRGPGGPGGAGNGGLTDISADPQYSVAVSEDFGQTWSPFAIAGTVPDAVNFSKPAFEYSRDGVLGLIWRASYADGMYDVWAVISRDGGKSFVKPVRVSHAKSPAFDLYRNAGLFGDDIQDLSMDKSNLHVVWGDSRSGFQGVWYGRVPLSAFDATTSSSAQR
jgi:hypothetical protein